MGKIIIDNKSSLSDCVVLDAVSQVIDMGRVSNNEKQYCYVVTTENLAIHSSINKCSDRFLILDNQD